MKSTFAILLKLDSINKYVKLNIKGIEINNIRTKISLCSCLEKIWNFKIIIKKKIAKITGTEEGLEANKKNVIKIISK
jgi:hypothetical protein